MKLTVIILSIFTSIILFAHGVQAERYREGKVYVTRPSSSQPALERSSMGASRDDERIVDENDPVVIKKEREKEIVERRARLTRDDQTVVVRRDESEDRIDRGTISPEPLAAREDDSSSRTSPRRTKDNFIDKNKDGYNDKRNVHDM